MYFLDLYVQVCLRVKQMSSVFPHESDLHCLEEVQLLSYLKIPERIEKKIKNDDAFNINLCVNSSGATVETDLADKVGHVEGGHDEDGQPLPKGGVPYL